MTKTDAGVFFFAKPGTDRYRALSTEAGEQA